jgi:hypothetical protein
MITKEVVMHINLIHGSTVGNLRHLEARVSGMNGSHDGIGVNLTSNASLALRYSGKEGFIYRSRVDVGNYIEISEDAKLNTHQAETLKELISILPLPDQIRLATDMVGQKERKFNSDYDADEFFDDQEMKMILSGLSNDRFMPEFKDSIECIVKYSHSNISDIANVSTNRIHKALMFWDINRGTEMLKSLGDGLILKKEGNGENYLSFNKVPIDKEYSGELLKRDDAALIIQRAARKPLSQEVGFTL